MNMMNPRLDRRSLLQSVLVAGGSLSFFGGFSSLARLARADTLQDRYYVFCYFSGGWDILLGLDPRDPQQFNNGTGCAKAFSEDQNYRPGLFSGFHRNKRPESVPATVPEIR